MAEKLTASAWTSFAKKRELDDGALLKALSKLDGVADDKHEARLDALEDLVTQLNKQVIALAKKKPPLPDKEQREVKDKLHALIEEAEKAQKETRNAKAAADAAEEEDDSPVLLTTKMVPLLREVKKGEVQMPVMVALAGKATAVLIMRRSISPTRRKLLAEYLDVTSGLKYINGHCVLEKGAVTFVVQTEAAGLAKRIRQALLDQTGQRLKVRVRGEDGAEDQDGEDEGDGQDSSTPEGSGNAPPAPSAAELNWRQRWPRVRAAALAVLQQGQHPDASKLRALLGFASEKGEVNRDPAAGLKALDMLEQLLKAAPAPAPAPAPSTASPPPPAPGTAPRALAPAIVYTQSRLAWVATRGKVKTELDKLEKTILKHYESHAVLPAVVRSVRKLDSVLEMFDESLSDQLDLALNATDAAEKLRCHDEARKVIERYRGYLATDPFVAELDGNPFVPVAVRATLSATLQTLASKIV